MSEPDPPLFTHPIQGVRVWELLESRHGLPMLRAQVQDQVWPRGEELRAACIGARRRHKRRDPHRSPDRDCSCGIYALHPALGATFFDLLDRLAYCDAGVIGAIDAWGRTELHESGFRAECARPAKLYATGHGGEAEAALLERAAAAYGVVLVELGDSRELVRELGRLDGLASPVVASLLKDVSELVLKPSGDHRGGTGFVPVTKCRRLMRRAIVLDVEVTDREALQSSAFGLCREVALVREPDQIEGIPSRLAVWDAERRLKVGLVPVSLGRWVALWGSRHKERWPLVTWQWRDRLGRRAGIRVLLPPVDRIVLQFGKPPRPMPLLRGDDPF